MKALATMNLANPYGGEPLKQGEIVDVKEDDEDIKAYLNAGYLQPIDEGDTAASSKKKPASD